MRRTKTEGGWVRFGKEVVVFTLLIENVWLSTNSKKSGVRCKNIRCPLFQRKQCDVSAILFGSPAVGGQRTWGLSR